MELSGSSEASLCAKTLLDYFRSAQLPVLHIQHIAIRPGATFFLPDTPGAEIHENVRPLAGEAVIQKHFPNSFRETALLEDLYKLQVNHLVIAGMMTHMCIDATTRAAFDLGFTCLVAEDACATRALQYGEIQVPAEQVQAAFLAALKSAYARVHKTEVILEELKG
jgi:nicotinamidase-related amidase